MQKDEMLKKKLKLKRFHQAKIFKKTNKQNKKKTRIL